MCTPKNTPHTDFMARALGESRQAFAQDDVPVGAVLVHKIQGIIFSGHNVTEKTGNPLDHAEILAINAGQKALGAPFLEACTLYVTLEPCLVCAASLAAVRLPQLVFGAYNSKGGAVVHGPGLGGDGLPYIGGVLEAPCSEILQAFFAQKRKPFKGS